MAGPPTAAWSQLTWLWGGPAVPTGRAAFTLGIRHGADAPDILDAAETLFDDLEPVLSASLRCDEVRLKQGPVATGPTFVRPIGEFCDNGAEMAGPQVAVLVDKRVTGVSGRYGGRLYLPGLTEAGSAPGGQVLPDTRSALQDIFDSFYALLSGLGCDPAVFPSTGGDPREVESFQVQARLATQRRRLRR